MQTYTSELENDQRSKTTRALAKKLDAIGWGVFLIWIGIAFLANFGWGVGLFGVGLVTLAVQLTRKYFRLPVEGFSLVIGTGFVVWGAWELLKTQLGEAPMGGNLLPILFIAVGVVFVVLPFLRKPER